MCICICTFALLHLCTFAPLNLCTLHLCTFAPLHLCTLHLHFALCTLHLHLHFSFAIFIFPNNADLETWWRPDLRQSSDNDERHDGYRQVAIVGVMMGDTNVVSVLAMAHECQHINAGVLRTDSLLLPERPLPQGNEFGDVYIDDLVLFSILLFSRMNEPDYCPRAARARNTYAQLSMPTAESKETAAFRAEFWGGNLDGMKETLGIPMCSRTSLMYVTLTGAVLGVTRTSLQQLLGAWNFALSFRREALCCLDVAFLAVGTLPTRRPIPPTGALLDDLLLVCGIAPLLQADLRASPRLELFATDTSPFGAGACVAPVAQKSVADSLQPGLKNKASMYASAGAPLRWSPRRRVVHVPHSSRPL